MFFLCKVTLQFSVTQYGHEMSSIQLKKYGLNVIFQLFKLGTVLHLKRDLPFTVENFLKTIAIMTSQTQNFLIF